MARAKVTFYVPVTDPDDRTGLTEEDYEKLTDRIMVIGGEDWEVEKVGDDE